MSELPEPLNMFTLASVDLDVAKHLYKTFYPQPLNVICFHCQQSAEKYLKGYLHLRGMTPPKIHDLNALRSLSQKYDASFIETKEACAHLINYGITPRYDHGLDLDVTMANHAIAQAESIQSFILARARELGYTPPEPPRESTPTL